MVEEGKKGEVCAAGLNIASGYVGGAQPDKFIHNKLDNDPGTSTLDYCECFLTSLSSRKGNAPRPTQ